MQLQHAHAVSLHGGLQQALTEREVEALELAGTGLSMKGIAQKLGISSGTVGWHLKNAYQKLGVGSREDALRKARAQHLIGGASTQCRVCSCRFDHNNVAMLRPAPAANR